ncbi:MAG: hypothetical protein ACC619_08755 [Paracoccaceae bacterium]
MRFIAISLLITLSACSVANLTERTSGTGFNYYTVPTINDK